MVQIRVWILIRPHLLQSNKIILHNTTFQPRNIKLKKKIRKNRIKMPIKSKMERMLRNLALKEAMRLWYLRIWLSQRQVRQKTPLSPTWNLASNLSSLVHQRKRDKDLLRLNLKVKLMILRYQMKLSRKNQNKLLKLFRIKPH